MQNVLNDLNLFRFQIEIKTVVFNDTLSETPMWNSTTQQTCACEQRSIGLTGCLPVASLWRLWPKWRRDQHFTAASNIQTLYIGDTKVLIPYWT